MMEELSQHKNDSNATNILSIEINLMGLSSDSEPLKFNINNNKNTIPLRNGGITLMGNCTDLKFRNKLFQDYKNNDNFNDEIKVNQSITSMGNTYININSNQSKKFKKRKNKISSESYWKMFIFQQPQIFTQIISYLLPFAKSRISNVATFISQFIMESQLKYIIKSNDNLMELKPIKLKTNWYKYDVIDYRIDKMIWKNEYSDLIIKYSKNEFIL